MRYELLGTAQTLNHTTIRERFAVILLLRSAT